MEIRFGPQAQKDLKYWKTSGSLKLQKRITELLTSISETPFAGIGKPEPLKHNLSGVWSRRINDEHRITYEVNNDIVQILTIKGHYH